MKKGKASQEPNYETSLFKRTDVIELTDDDFDLSNPAKPLLKLWQPGLIMFYSAGCPHCIDKKEAYTKLGKALNRYPGYQIYAVPTMDPNTNKISRALSVFFIPAFFEADHLGQINKLENPDFQFDYKNAMNRAKLKNREYEEMFDNY